MEVNEAVAGPSGGTKKEKKPERFRFNEIIEAMEKRDCSKIRLAEIDDICGNWLHVQYVGDADDDSGYWFHKNSNMIHKAGWSRAVGIILAGMTIPNLHFLRPPAEEFLPTPVGINIDEDMMFEMRHPIFPGRIVAGHVYKTLRYGYFIAKTDLHQPEILVEIPLHVTSDYILPLNFCKDHHIKWNPPKMMKQKPFSWGAYLKENCLQELDLSLVNRPHPNPYKEGDELKVKRIVSPIQFKKATVIQVAGHLIKVHFSGNPVTDDYCQWISWNSGFIAQQEDEDEMSETSSESESSSESE